MSPNCAPGSQLKRGILFKTLIEPFGPPEDRGYEEFDDLGLTLGPLWVFAPTSIEECESGQTPREVSR